MKAIHSPPLKMHVNVGAEFLQFIVSRWMLNFFTEEIIDEKVLREICMALTFFFFEAKRKGGLLLPKMEIKFNCTDTTKSNFEFCPNIDMSRRVIPLGFHLSLGWLHSQVASPRGSRMAAAAPAISSLQLCSEAEKRTLLPVCLFNKRKAFPEVPGRH